ncbi:MAG: hypothetical protein UR26_C0003G0012 [candidate division TM6 bacterium GW2011_GWF2_32_72]|nr:MAG: hypothetical protein UR26_C0003G0012 [candidate division TM6 bacterium GW2011_GWF2_32_72]
MNIKKIYNDWSVKLLNNKYSKEIVAGVGFVVVVGGGAYLYRMYVNNREDAAIRAFSDCLDETAKALNLDYGMAENKKDQKDVWDDLEMAYSAGVDQHSSSKLAGYFKIYQAGALSKEGKQEEAIALMKQAVKEIPSASLLKPLYQNKYALMMMDSKDESVQKEGLSLLESLANDSTNQNADLSLYFLGLYYWSKNDLSAVKNVWGKLVKDFSSEDKNKDSAWAQLAKERLDSIQA